MEHYYYASLSFLTYFYFTWVSLFFCLVCLVSILSFTACHSRWVTGLLVIILFLGYLQEFIDFFCADYHLFLYFIHIDTLLMIDLDMMMLLMELGCILDS